MTGICRKHKVLITREELEDCADFQIMLDAITKIRDLCISEQHEFALAEFKKVVENYKYDTVLFDNLKYITEDLIFTNIATKRLSQWFLENECCEEEDVSYLYILVNHRYLELPLELLDFYLTLGSSRLDRLVEPSPLLILTISGHIDKVRLYLRHGYSSNIKFEEASYLYLYHPLCGSVTYSPKEKWVGQYLEDILTTFYPEVFASQ